MKSLRIVLALHEPPLPFGGPAARWYYVLLRGLVSRGHRVTAIAPCHDRAEAEKAAHLFPAPAYDLRCHPIIPKGDVWTRFNTLRRPFTYVYGPQYRADLNAILAAGFDILHAEQLWTGWLGLEHLDRLVVNVHYLFSIDWSKAKGGSFGDHLLRYTAIRAERHLVARLRNVITLTPRLTDAVKLANPLLQATTVPMALDLSIYPFDENGPQGKANLRPPTLSLIGSFNWTPSYQAGVRLLTQLWPAILARVPDARLQVVGRCAKTAFARLPPPPRTEFYQDVPDTFPYFASTDVLLYAPDVGSGMKVKIMEAFALGTPVVTNPDGVEGLPASDGVHAGIAVDNEGLIHRAVRLLEDADARSRQRLAARQMLEKFCDPNAVVDRLMPVYEQMLSSQRSSSADELPVRRIDSGPK